MAMPKGYRTNIDIIPKKFGPDRRQEILDDISYKGTFLPKGVLEEDMDASFVDFIKSDERISMTIDGEKIPVIFLTIQRWTEFSKTWQFSDKYKNIELPFITIVRKPDIQQGENQAGLWNIPGNRTYTYLKVPTWDGNRKGVDLYKIPQPTSVDMTYEVRIFTNKMKQLNKFNRKIQRAFQSRQCYINVNGHPMPLHLESIGDESNIDDFENKRFYVQMYEMKLLGYILDEDDFEVVPTLNRTVMTLEVEEKLNSLNLVAMEAIKLGDSVNFTFIWKPRAELTFEFVAQYSVDFSIISEIENITRIVISVNNISVFDGTILNTPILIRENDRVKIRVYKNDLNNGKFKLIGSTI
jgi:hypothetical protein